MVTVSHEREVKLGCAPEFELPDLTAVPGVAHAPRQPRMTLTAAYYDTADLQLARWGITLRRRTGGKDDGWTLKLPEATSRAEVTMPLTAARRPPAELARLVSAYTRGAALRLVTTLVTIRTTVVLQDRGNNAWAEVVRDAVAALRGGREVASWHELEVEALTDSAQLSPVVAVLVAAGARPSSQTSKAIRALGERARLPPDPPPPEPFTRSSPAGQLATAALREATRTLMTQDPRVRLGGEDAVHQMRVAARRLRSVLLVFAPLVDPIWLAEVRAELGWLGTALGDARDHEVVLDLVMGELDQLLGDGVGSAAIRSSISATLARLSPADSGGELLDDPRWARLLRQLVLACASPPLTPASELPVDVAATPLVARAWRRLTTQAERLDRRRPEAEAYHRMRILTKRLRYAVEALEPAHTRSAGRLGTKLADQQAFLGDYNDVRVARELLARMVASGGLEPAAAFLLGQLDARFAARARADLRAFHRQWTALAAPKATRWLTRRG